MVMASPTADYIGLANAPVLWILAMAVMGVVVVQSLIYMTAVRKNAESIKKMSTPPETRENQM